MTDLLMAAALLCGGLAFAWIWLRLQPANGAPVSEWAEMGTILFGVLLTGMVSIGTAYSFSGALAFGLDGWQGNALQASVFVLPVVWLVLLGRIVRFFDHDAVPETPTAPVNDNRNPARDQTARRPARRKAA
ncbi:hypothetical protein [Pacificispira sp.]|uniref:hypothetical protein n=1 Tax=Pacificispira sp. TaxID=2888761 RepID=UPI003BAB7666